MKRLLLLFAALFFSISSMAGDTAPPDVQEARAAVAGFASALKAELQSAIKTGGPVAAIEVCHSEAPVIAASTSAQSGLSLSRTSLRHRNPANEPTDWQREILMEFDRQRAGGAEPSLLEWFAEADADGQREFRYMKAIPAQAICLQCHGEVLAPDVAERIADLYPNDQATGYRLGELRGAFIVRKELESP